MIIVIMIVYYCCFKSVTVSSSQCVSGGGPWNRWMQVRIYVSHPDVLIITQMFLTDGLSQQSQVGDRNTSITGQGSPQGCTSRTRTVWLLVFSVVISDHLIVT